MDIAKYWTELDCCDQAFNRDEAGFRRATLLLLLLFRFYLPFQAVGPVPPSQISSISPHHLPKFSSFSVISLQIVICFLHGPANFFCVYFFFLIYVSLSTFFFGNPSLFILMICLYKLICFFKFFPQLLVIRQSPLYTHFWHVPILVSKFPQMLHL